MKILCMMHLCCYPENKDSNSGPLRIQQYVNGLKKFFEYGNILKNNNIDIVLVDNNISSTSSFPSEILNVLPENVKTITFKNNKYGKINKGSGLIEKWLYCKELIARYDWIIHFEPRLLLIDFSFVETFLKSPCNLFTDGCPSNPNISFFTGIFCIDSKLLLAYINTIELSNFHDSIEYNLFRYVNHNQQYKILDKANLMWFNSVDKRVYIL